MNSRDVREQWAGRTGAYSPTYYAHHGPDATSEAIAGLIEGHLDGGPAVLEVGCSSGRHLAHLHEAGFEDLSGIEVNDDAFEVMAETYPALGHAGTFYRTAAQAVLPTFERDQFQAVFSVETLQHVPPSDEWVFAELARITEGLVITAEVERPAATNGADRSSEGAEPAVTFVDDELPLYYRDWGEVFAAVGLTQVAVIDRDRLTVRAFRSPPDEATADGR